MESNSSCNQCLKPHGHKPIMALTPESQGIPFPPGNSIKGKILPMISLCQAQPLQKRTISAPGLNMNGNRKYQTPIKQKAQITGAVSKQMIQEQVNAGDVTRTASLGALTMGLVLFPSAFHFTLIALKGIVSISQVRKLKHEAVKKTVRAH